MCVLSLRSYYYRAFITWQEGVDAVIAITHFLKQFSVYVRQHWVNIVGITNESIFIHSSKQGIEAVFLICCDVATPNAECITYF